jgi:PAS domain S-box-containing protein
MPTPAELLDLVMDAVFVVDQHGRLLYASAGCTPLLGYAPAELVGSYVIEHVHPDDRSRTLHSIWQITAGAPSTRFSNRWRHKDGRDVALQWAARWSEAHKVRVAVARAAAPGAAPAVTD